jgi:hypothetical protein
MIWVTNHWSISSCAVGGWWNWFGRASCPAAAAYISSITVVFSNMTSFTVPAACHVLLVCHVQLRHQHFGTNHGPTASVPHVFSLTAHASSPSISSSYGRLRISRSQCCYNFPCPELQALPQPRTHAALSSCQPPTARM